MLSLRLILTRALFVARLCADFFQLLLGAFSSHKESNREPDETRSSFGFGALNYRTGRIGNGLDPNGWYDLD